MIIDFRTLIFRSKFNSHGKELQQLQPLLHDQGHVSNERQFLLDLMLFLATDHLAWFLNVSIITRRSSCQITLIRPFIFCQFSLTRFTCPLFGCRPSFPHIMVNSSSSAAASSNDRNIHGNCFIIPLLVLPFLRLSFIQIILSSVQIILSFISGTLRYLCNGESGDRGTAHTLNDSVFCVFCKVMEMTLATSTTYIISNVTYYSNSMEVCTISSKCFQSTPFIFPIVSMLIWHTHWILKNSGQIWTTRFHIDQGKWRSSTLSSLYFSLQVVVLCL